MLQAAPVAYKGVCFSSEDAAYEAFLLDWPQSGGSINYSLQSSSLIGDVISFTKIDDAFNVFANQNITLSICTQPSLGFYPIQDILFPSILVLVLLLGFGHGFKFTGNFNS